MRWIAKGHATALSGRGLCVSNLCVECSRFICALPAQMATLPTSVKKQKRAETERRRGKSRKPRRVGTSSCKQPKGSAYKRYFMLICCSTWFLTFCLVNRNSFFSTCYDLIEQRLDFWNSELDTFHAATATTAISTDTVESFRTSVVTWHRQFKKIVEGVAGDFHTDDIGETCLHGVLQTYTALNVAALLFLCLIFSYFVYQETRTPYGASRNAVEVAAHGFSLIFGILVLLNVGPFKLVKSMVNVSTKFKTALVGLRQRQVTLIDDDLLNFENLDLRTSMWDGYRFGFRDPVFNQHFDEEQFASLVPFAMLIGLIVIVIVASLWYRARTSLVFRWRLGIQSTVCIGIVRPGERVIRRVGSGCLVNSVNGEIGVLTNWHLFRTFQNLENQEKVENMRKRLGHMNFLEDKNVYTNGIRVSWSNLLPGTKIVIGTTANKRINEMKVTQPRWEILAEYPDNESQRLSPAKEFTENGDGLDLAYLKIARKLRFHALQERDSSSMQFSSLEMVDIASTHRGQDGFGKWNAFTFGNPEALVHGLHKLRLLGYPGIGGHKLTVVTSYYTGSRTDVGGGSWLLTAAPMPNGCSGGAVVNPDGELVGVATQTLGQVSHIRSIEDALRVGILGNDESHAFLPREVPPSLTASPNSENTTRSMKRNLTPKGMHRKRLEVLPHHHQKLGGTSVSSRGSQKENATPNPSGGGRLGRLWSEILTNYTVVRTGSVGRRNNGTQLLSKKTD